MIRADEICRVAVIGSGLIGAGWATLFASHGCQVSVYDVDEGALEKARERIAGNLSYLVEQGVYTQDQMATYLAAVSYTTDISRAAAQAQFIQENGPDRIEIKRSILAQLEQYAPADAIYASSTSALLISEIAKETVHPERCIGGHPYNPPHLIPLVEITKGDETAPEVVQTAYDFYKRMGKEPVILHKESMGFIANRLQAALNRELVDLVMRGVCSVEDADKACTFGPGLRWGIMGQTLIAHLGGGEKGIKGMIDLTQASSKPMNGSLANWSEMPAGWADAAQEGVLEEIAHRSPEEGNDIPSLTAYRDHMLVELLRLHKKL